MTSNRRTFLKAALSSTAALPFFATRALGANDAIRLGVIGMGSTVKLGGKGRGDALAFTKIAGVRVTAVCDCDADNLARAVGEFKKRGDRVTAFKDFRKLLDDREIDAVSISTPNHWHSLMGIMACRAGKDAFIQKPASHNIFEGRKLVEAAAKHGRIVQTTHGPRNKGSVEEAFEYARRGELGKIICVHGLNYKPRMSIGKVKGPRPIPKACDYDLWCGPAPKKPLERKNLHYDWHWDWDTGNGDLGNMGIHYVDACRWALGEMKLPERVLSIGGRLGYDDDGQTPNSLITLFDYRPVPIIFEVRGLPRNASLRRTKWNAGSMDSFRGVKIGTIVACEGGYVQGGAAYDNDGRRIKKFTRERTNTKQNFIDAVRNRDAKSLHSPAIEGHLSCGLVHLANISHRIGTEKPIGEIREAIKGNAAHAGSFARLLEHLKLNEIDASREPLTLGAALTFDTAAERFKGPLADEANRLISRDYREPFVVA